MKKGRMIVKFLSQKVWQGYDDFHYTKQKIYHAKWVFQSLYPDWTP